MLSLVTFDCIFAGSFGRTDRIALGSDESFASSRREVGRLGSLFAIEGPALAGTSGGLLRSDWLGIRVGF
jgi:hypothetical protein